MTTLLEASAPTEQEPVAAQCKFDSETTWGWCSIEHHNLVQSEPEKWPQYTTRLLYTQPQEVAYWREEFLKHNTTSSVIQSTEQESMSCIPEHWMEKAKQIADGPIAYPDAERARQAIALIKILLKASPQKLQPLTDDEIWKDDRIMAANSGYGVTFETLRGVVRAIEAAHGITGDKE